MFGFPRASLSMPPSDYFRRQCFVSVEEVERRIDGLQFLGVKGTTGTQASFLDLHAKGLVYSVEAPFIIGTPGTATLSLIAAVRPASD